MKILFVNAYSPQTLVGGAERVMVAMMKALQGRGHEICMAGTAAGGELAHASVDGFSIWEAGIRNVYWPQPDKARAGWERKVWHLLDIYNFGMGRELEAVVAAEKPDVAVLHGLVGWSVSAVNALASWGVPMVQVLHDHYMVCVNSMMFRGGHNCVKQCADCWLMRAPHRRITNKVSAVVGVSQYILDRHLAEGAFADVPLKRVIHNAVSGAALGVDAAAALRAEALAVRGDCSIRFGFIGYISDFKGIEYLLQVFVGLDLPKAELWIGGKGKPDYIAMLKRKYPHAGIRFLGQVLAREFFTAIDVTIVPSLWQENFPGVIVESFAFGVPVIGSRRGGIPEMGLEKGAGIIFEPDEPGALAEAMRLCANDGEKLRDMAAEALRQSAPFVEIQEWVMKYDRILNEAFQSFHSQVSQ